ncbi:glycosyltransferase [Winogradskyella vincentii]|uniref:Glycosyltransferase n=1 Tax=Winogradskyella vincentii TaxID=2877122 RepID=A0ABS7Y1N0_9FLAO|nr:glycosyltransferase [Winogradskyella vincentii]MCA0153149.1 glycosyltransferase [Winogradskyella vincentii]
MLQELIENCPKKVDLTNKRHLGIITETVEIILEDLDIQEIEKIEQQLISKNDDSLIFILLSFKIAKSKLLTSKITEPLKISVVFAVYKEHNRILKKSEHPHGEDFLLRKVNQLQWLFNDQPLITWELIIVDDGCPEGSGKIAQDIIDKNNLNDQVRVLFLADAIEQGQAVVKSLTSTRDSQKGGSIVYGMWNAIQQKTTDNSIVIYTDADLSTHLGQLMLLVDPLLHQNKLVALGSRRESNSVVIKKGVRNNRGKLFIYLWKRLIPNLGDIVDTQCGFKAFKAEIIPHIINDLIESKFAFDIELLLKTELFKKGSIIKIPIAWIDSEEASTTTDLQPYLSMLKSIAMMNKRYFHKQKKDNEFVSFIESLNEERFNILLDNIPRNITIRNPDEFTDYDEVRVADLLID